MSNKTFSIIWIVTLIGVGAWLILWLLTYRHTDTKGETIESLRRDSARAANENSIYREKYDSLQDTIAQLTRQTGWLEMELGAKRDELQQANARYRGSRQIKDTARALSICDSIVYTYAPSYLAIDSSTHVYSDSVSTVLGQAVERQNNVIELQFNKQDSIFATRISEEKEAKKNRRHNRRELIKAGTFGAAIGVLIALIFGG